MAVKWYEFKANATGNSYRVCNPSFAQRSCETVWVICGVSVTEAEFDRVLAEWEADQQATEPDREEPQWAPKVGDWVRVKESGRTEAVGRVAQIQVLTPSCGARLNIFPDQTFYTGWLEPAGPQPIDKLGWWLIDGRPEVLVTCHSDLYFYDCDGEQCEVMTHKGIFLAEITDEEIAAYHREGIVPKCPVEVQS